MVNKYFVLGASVILILCFYLSESESEDDDFDHIGVVGNVYETSSGGFSFVFQDIYGSEFRCYSYDEPTELGLYGLNGSLSSDGNMFFVSSMVLFDG